MPPALVLMSDFQGEWAAYEAELYRIFVTEIARGMQFRGQPVNCRRIPETDNRWASYWHLIQEGRIEDDRTPDIRRCERLAWIPWVIDNWNNADANIEWWENRRGSETSVLLWFNEEYLVIVAKRDGYWLLKSAYQTHQSHRMASLRRERDRFHA